MAYKTWTRKANAETAVKKVLADEQFEKYHITAIYAGGSVAFGQTGNWMVTVELDDTPSEAAELQEAIGKLAKVIGKRAEPAPKPKPAPKPAPKATGRKSFGRSSPFKGRKISVSGGKDAANPYRAGTQSHAAFDFVQKNPNTKFEDLRGMGVRIRTITECLRHGQMRSSEK